MTLIFICGQDVSSLWYIANGFHHCKSVIIIPLHPTHPRQILDISIISSPDPAGLNLPRPLPPPPTPATMSAITQNYQQTTSASIARQQRDELTERFRTEGIPPRQPPRPQATQAPAPTLRRANAVAGYTDRSGRNKSGHTGDPLAVTAGMGRPGDNKQQVKEQKREFAAQDRNTGRNKSTIAALASAGASAGAVGAGRGFGGVLSNSGASSRDAPSAASSSRATQHPLGQQKNEPAPAAQQTTGTLGPSSATPSTRRMTAAYLKVVADDKARKLHARFDKGEEERPEFKIFRE